MKKKIASFIAALLIMACMPLTVFAAETNEMVPVVAQVPADWADPCCWAWSAPDGTNAFTAWPGEPLTLDGDWYAIEAPGWINSVIINGNEGSVQTSDLSVETGKDLWVVVDSPESATVYYEVPTEAPVEEANTEEAVAETVQDAVVDVASEAVSENTDENNSGLIVGIVVVAIALAGGAVVVTKKNKKK